MNAPTLSPEARAMVAVPAGIERHAVDPVGDREAWLALRRRDVTASQVAALLGKHEYSTPYELYAQKVGLLPDEEVEPTIDENSISLPPMLRGSALEPSVPGILHMLRPQWTIAPAGYYYRDPTVRIGATPDFWAVDPDRPGFGSIQVKTCDRTTFTKKWRAEGEPRGEIAPVDYILVQAVVEAVLTGASWVEVAVLVTGFTLDLHLISVPLHFGLIDRLKAEVAHFWRQTDAGKEPDLQRDKDGWIVPRDGKLLGRLFEPNGKEIDFTGDNEVVALVDRKGELSEAAKGIEAEQASIKAELILKLDGATTGRLADGRAVTARRIAKAPYSVIPKPYIDVRVKAAPRNGARA